MLRLPMSTEKKSLPLGVVALFQAAGLTAYCLFIVAVMFQGNNWFSKIPEYFAPLILLVTLSTSALICGLITLGYPIIIFFNEKNPRKALRLIVGTVLYLIVFVLLFILANILFHK